MKHSKSCPKCGSREMYLDEVDLSCLGSEVIVTLRCLGEDCDLAKVVTHGEAIEWQGRS